MASAAIPLEATRSQPRVDHGSNRARSDVGKLLFRSQERRLVPRGGTWPARLWVRPGIAMNLSPPLHQQLPVASLHLRVRVVASRRFPGVRAAQLAKLRILGVVG